MDKSPDAFRTISEAAEELDLPQHVLRFWETRFPQIKPMKRGGGRRYYRQEDVELLASIRHLLYGEGYTIKGVQRILKQQHGAAAVIELVHQLRTQRAPAGAAALANARTGEEDAEELESTEGGVERSEGADIDRPVSVLRQPQTAHPGLSEAERRIVKQVLAEIDECLAILATARAA